MKKLYRLSIVLCLLLSLSSCGERDETPPPTQSQTVEVTTQEPETDHVSDIVDQVSAAYTDLIQVTGAGARTSDRSFGVILNTPDLQDLYGRCQAEEAVAWQEWDETTDQLLAASAGLTDIMRAYDDDRIISVQILSEDGETSYFTMTSNRVLYNGLDSIKEAAEAKEAAKSGQSTSESGGNEQSYVLNTSTHVFHSPSCSSVKDIKDKNKQSAYGTREEMIARGYKPCGRCKP